MKQEMININANLLAEPTFSSFEKEGNTYKNFVVKIENLIYKGKGFVERDKKNLIAIHKGISLVTIVSDTFKSAETTAKLEMELSDIAQGKSSKEEFLEAIEIEIKEAILKYRK